MSWWSSCRRDKRSRVRVTAAATSLICTAPFQNQRAQSLYLAYTARSQYGINPRGRSVTTFIRRWLSVVLRDQFGENLAAAVPRIRPVNAGGGDQDDLIDAGRCGGFENLEGAAHIEVEKIVGVFFAAIFVDAVPGGDVDDTVATAKYLRQRRAVQNGPFDEHGSLVQRRRRSNIENDRRVTFVEQLGYEGLPEISRSPGQQHLHGLFPGLHLSDT